MRANFGLTGNKDFCSDFNRDGAVNFGDTAVFGPNYNVLLKCASRFEGDANGDGAVEDCDFDILMTELQSAMPLRPCACEQQMAGGGGEMMLALNNTELAELSAQIPDSADMDGDGTVDEHDIAALDAAIYAAFDNMKATKDAAAVTPEAGPQPTFAEPQPEFAPAGGNDEPVPAPRAFPPGLPMPPDSMALAWLESATRPLQPLLALRAPIQTFC